MQRLDRLRKRFATIQHAVAEKERIDSETIFHVNGHLKVEAGSEGNFYFTVDGEEVTVKDGDTIALMYWIQDLLEEEDWDDLQEGEHRNDSPFE